MEPAGEPLIRIIRSGGMPASSIASPTAKPSLSPLIFQSRRTALGRTVWKAVIASSKWSAISLSSNRVSVMSKARMPACHCGSSSTSKIRMGTVMDLRLSQKTWPRQALIPESITRLVSECRCLPDHPKFYICSVRFWLLLSP
jgi:hypothetical protein